MFVILCGLDDRESYGAPDVLGLFPDHRSADEYLQTGHGYEYDSLAQVTTCPAGVTPDDHEVVEVGMVRPLDKED